MKRLALFFGLLLFLNGCTQNRPRLEVTLAGHPKDATIKLASVKEDPNFDGRVGGRKFWKKTEAGKVTLPAGYYYYQLEWLKNNKPQKKMGLIAVNESRPILLK